MRKERQPWGSTGRKSFLPQNKSVTKQRSSDVRPRLRHRTSLENNQGIFIIEGALSGGNIFDPAISDFTKAIHMGPPFSDAYFARGSVYSNHGNLEEAISDTMV